MTKMDMRVVKYIPSGMYGFVRGSQDIEIYFHLGVFNPLPAIDSQSIPRCPHCLGCAWSQGVAPPIVGEEVEVEIVLPDAPRDRAPKAKRVTRLAPPKMVVGVVDTFDAYRGYGFVNGLDGITYHIHRSEVLGGYLPVTGQTVRFYSGTRQNRPRACHVQICTHIGK